MHDQRRRYALALLALLPGSAFAQTNAYLSWNHDGANVSSFRVYAGRAVDALTEVAQVSDPALRTTIVPGLASGVWYFELTALGPTAIESARSNTACVALGSGSCPLPAVIPPGPVLNLVVTPVVAPPPGVGTITLTGIREFRLVVPAGMRANIRAVPPGAFFDWVKVGGETGTDIPTTPPLGPVNNDGILSNSITVDGPIDAMTDTDGSVPTGFAVTVNGVTKQLVQSGTTWSGSFP